MDAASAAFGTVDKSIAGRYARYSTDRHVYLDRARECASLTIPALIPPDGSKRTRGYKFPQPYQGVGARGVNNLASKLLLSLFPANTPFFRLAIDDFDVEQLMAQVGKKGRGLIEKALNKIERSVSQDVETSALGTRIHEGLKHLLVAGNVILYIDPENGQSKVIGLDRFVVRRDSLGNVVELIVVEEVAFQYIPEKYREKIIEEQQKSSEDDEVTIYTQVRKLDDGRWEAVQEVCAQVIEETRGFYPSDKCPWIALRLIPVTGEDYGRSFVEEQLGDLNSLEKLTKAIVQFASAAAKIIFLAKPNSTTNVKALAKAQSGDFVKGRKEDIDVLQIEKYADFQVAQTTAREIKSSLEMAFLLNSAIRRDAERVTAEEIRQIARELDEGLGGIHSTLSQELQLPVVTILMWRKQREGKLPPLPKGMVKPVIVTGVQALGRGTDLQNLTIALNHLAGLGQLPEQALMRLNIEEYVARVFAHVGVDAEGLIKGEEEMAAEQQQAQLQQLVQGAAPGAIQTAIKEGMKNGQQ